MNTITKLLLVLSSLVGVGVVGTSVAEVVTDSAPAAEAGISCTIWTSGRSGHTACTGAFGWQRARVKCAHYIYGDTYTTFGPKRLAWGGQTSTGTCASGYVVTHVTAYRY